MNSKYDTADATHDDLAGAEARQKIRQLVNDASNCFFVTRTSYPGSTNARPMAVQEIDGDGNFWFVSSTDTHKDRELQNNPEVYLYFQSSSSGEFLEILGRASVSQDQQRIEELWKPEFNAWFEMGKEDPKISVIKVAPREGHYWDTEHGGLAAGMRSMLSNFFLQKPEYAASEGHLRL